MNDPYEEPNKASEKAVKSLERCDYYLEQKNYQQALKDYANSISSLSWCFLMMENIERARTGRVFYTIEQKIDIIFPIANLVGKISLCYQRIGDFRKANMFLKELQRIIEELAKYQSNFDLEEIKKYEYLTQSQAYGEIGGAAMELLKEGQIKDELPNNADYSDPVFERIRNSLDDIFMREMCLLPQNKIAESTETFPSFVLERKDGYIILAIGIFLIVIKSWIFGFAFIAIFIWLLFGKHLA